MFDTDGILESIFHKELKKEQTTKKHYFVSIESQPQNPEFRINRTFTHGSTEKRD